MGWTALGAAALAFPREAPRAWLVARAREYMDHVQALIRAVRDTEVRGHRTHEEPS